MSLEDIAAAANSLAELLEAKSKKTGLKHPRHARHIAPALSRIKTVLRAYWARQELTIVRNVAPRIPGAMAAFAHVKEARSTNGKRFASQVLPDSLSPLRFSATAAEADEYSAAIADLVAGAGKTIATELQAGTVDVADFASRYLRDNSLSKLTGQMESETTSRLQNAIADAWDAGGSYDQVVSAITSTFDDFDAKRADLIAQTEVADAYNDARDQIATDGGFTEKAWETESGDPCPVCVENEDAGYIDIDDYFPSGDDQPTAHPNCMCSLKYRLSPGAMLESDFAEA